MSERIGICQDCGQRFGGIPDTVTATKVRCKECSGTVAIPPLVSAAPPADAPAPAAGGGLAATPVGDAPKKVERPAAAAPVDREVARPAKKEAPKAPEAKKPVAPPKPVFAPKKLAKPVKPIANKPVVPVKPIAKKPVAPVQPVVAKKPVAPAKPAAAAPDAEAAKKARAAAIIAKAKAKRAQEEGAAPAKKKSGADVLAALKAKREAGGQADKPAAKRTASAGGTRKSSARRSSRRDADEEEGGRRGSRAAKKGGPPMGLLTFSVIGLVVIAGGYYWWQGRQDDEGTPENTEVTGPQTPGDGGTSAAPVVDDLPPPIKPLTNLPSGEGDAGTNDPAGNTGTEAPVTPPTVDTPPSAEFAVPGAWEPIETRGITDVNLLDLMSVPLLPMLSGSTEEEFAEIKDDLETYLEDGGARSNRAGKYVVDAGQAAFPVILNAMMRLDYSTKAGNYTGGTLNNLLYRVGKENKNFPWKAIGLLEPGSKEFNDAALWNKKVVGSLQRFWVNQLAESDKAWQTWITKTAPKKEE
jgi:DNA-directed RNA polymerase subunit RPC12/RpoP